MQMRNDITEILLKLIKVQTYRLQSLYNRLRFISCLSVFINIVSVFCIFHTQLCNIESHLEIITLLSVGGFVIWIMTLLNYMHTYNGGFEIWKIIANELEWGRKRKSIIHKGNDERIKILSDFYDCGNYFFSPVKDGYSVQRVLLYVNCLSMFIVITHGVLCHLLLLVKSFI